MNIYLRQDEIKPGALVKAMSRDNEIVPALIMSFVDTGATDRAFVRVMDTEGSTYLANTLYLERWG